MRTDSAGRKRFDLFPYLMLLPAWIVILGITAYPFVYSFSMSFYNFSFLKQGTKFIGMKNYLDIIGKGEYLATLRFTVLWTVINVVFMTLLGFAVALIMRQRFVGKSVMKATMLIPWVLPQVVTGYTFSLMLSTDYGIVNKTLQTLGVLPQDFSWFAKPGPATCAVLLANIWRGIPFIALMLYARMQTVPGSLMEAAAIDGAGAIQQFRYIMLPHINQVLITCMLLTFLWSFNAFDIIKVMTDGGPLKSTNTLALLVNREAFSYLEISRACTMAVIMLVILLAFVFVLTILHRSVTAIKNREGRIERERLQ